ncbi:universal stress protein [Actinomycetospora sp. CA-053990]|uniref:universal stress protein n=1 Tax=Actinomycetospora sp. CA-053990 TaxID=3239891 RepID=UPI003D948BA0
MPGTGLGSGARGTQQPQPEIRPIERPERVGIVVGVDGSLSVLGAVAWAGVEATRRGVGLHLVQVLPPLRNSGSRSEVPRGRARVLLHRAMGAVGTVVPDVPITMATIHGSVGPALVSYAAQAPLLVLGAPGAGSVAMSAGRAGTHVSTHAACPVVVVPPKWAGSWSPTPSLRPVVVGVDDSDGGARALWFAAEAAVRLGVDLLAVAAENRFRIASPDGPEREPLPSRLAICRTSHPGLSMRFRVVEAGAAEALVRAARDAQLVVVGSRGRGTAAGALLGSTSQDLLRESPCPVVVLSPRTPAPPALRSAMTPASATAPGNGGPAAHDAENQVETVPS